jgi:O-antigen ligase
MAGLALGAWLLWNQTSIAHATSRFVIDRELRPELWRDTIYATRQYFPFGVGMGNFTPAILAGERLEVVRETLPNQAHNDFLELLLEAGVFGVVVLFSVTTVIFDSARRLLGVRLATHSQAVFALSGLILIAAHSVVDYPVRTMAITCLVAACIGMLMAARQDPAEEPRSAQTWE